MDVEDVDRSYSIDGPQTSRTSFDIDDSEIDFKPLLPASIGSAPRLRHSTSWIEEAKSRIASIRQQPLARVIYILCGVAVLLPVVLLVVANISHTRRPVPIGLHWQGFDKIENWFAFGDSWTTTHFSTASDQPSRKNPLGNPAYPGHTSSNGPNYVGYLTTQYNHSFIKTWDLAFAGSVVDTHNDKALLDWLDLAHQVKDEFLRYYTMPSNITGDRLPKEWNSTNTLFSMFFGINDVCVTDREHPHLDKTFTSYESFVGQLYNASARNFLLINVPPLQYAPNSVLGNPEVYVGVDNDVTQFNLMLDRLVRHLREKHPDITIFDFDLHDLFGRMVGNPKSFVQTESYKNVSLHCREYANHLKPMHQPTSKQIEICGGLKVEEHLWRDGLHVTSPVHELIAAGLEQMLASNGTSFM